MSNRSDLIRVDPEFKKLLRDIKKSSGLDLSDRKITKLITKKLKKNRVIEL